MEIKVIDPSWEIINEPDWAAEMAKIESIARTCYKSESKTTAGSAERMVKMLRKRGHHAMLEFADLIVRFFVDRGVSHEIVRHRHCSFAQESTRYVNYNKKGIEFVRPPFGDDESFSVWHDNALSTAGRYVELMAFNNWTPEQARGVLPNSLKTEVVVKANVREWLHIFDLRCAKEAHPQMREVMIPLRDYLAGKCPELFAEEANR